MALRARLAPPPPKPKQDQPWHTVKSGTLWASLLFTDERRMEAETYLSPGFALRQAIESKPEGWLRLGELAKAWMPGRLKGIQVRPRYGTPFLTATQVYSIRPVPRKWLALARTYDAEKRFIEPGTIVVTCSGSVGRPTLAFAAHKNVLISHDLLRVEALNERDKGWLYAYLHSPQGRAMTTSTKYGHIIKHLETSHLDALPIPTVADVTAQNFNERLARILELRNEGYRLMLEAEARFTEVLGPLRPRNWGEKGFTVKASKTLFGQRRRFEASVHNPGVASIRRHLAKNGQGFTTVAEAGYDVWLPTRFRRVPAEDGVRLVGSADLLETNPTLSKRIADGDFGDPFRGRVEPGWILLARSGQAYGIIGTAVLAGEHLQGDVISDHVMRIRPKDGAEVPPGYLVTALSHPLLGRPIVKSLAYGSSIPEIEVADLASLAIVRLDPGIESEIAGLAESAAAARAAADTLEREMAMDAGKIIERFTGKGLAVLA